MSTESVQPETQGPQTGHEGNLRVSGRADRSPRLSRSSHAGGADHDAQGDRLSGLGKVLIAVYLVLATAATFRSIYQIATKFDEAPLAYTLSAVSGIVYIVASVALIKHRGVWRVIAWCALLFELVGVIVVGALSITHPELFAHPSVWSRFGNGYGYIPLVLPALGLLWLSRTKERSP